MDGKHLNFIVSEILTKMMIKKYSLFVFIMITVFSYSQEITFQKNSSLSARKLLVVQKLNEIGDSLILESESKKIRQIDILNEEYLQTIKVDSVKAKIDLKEIPNGNYVIQARISRDWIVMYMTKRHYISAGLKYSDIKIDSKLDFAALRTKVLKGDTLSTQQHSVENNLEKKTMYWVVYEINSQFSSAKTMSLKCADEIYDLIAKIRLELKSEIGKNNKLFVYEVYDTSEFMSNQLKNIKYYKKIESKFFNVIPLFSSEDYNGNTSSPQTL